MTKLFRLVDGGRKELRTTSSMSASVPATSTGDVQSALCSATRTTENCTLTHAQSVPLTHAQYRSLSYQTSALPAFSLHKDFGSSLLKSERPRPAKFDFLCTEAGPKVQPDSPTSLRDLVQPIAWKYQDYPVASAHLLSSATPEALDERIREVLKREHINFVVETRDSLRYVCSKTVDSAVYKFTILISSLLKSCQNLLDNKFLVEVVRNRTSGFCEPLIWRNLTGALLGGLNQAEVEKNVDQQTSEQDQDKQRTEEPIKRGWSVPLDEDGFNPVESFLGIFGNFRPNIESEALAEMLLLSTQGFVNSGREVKLREGGLDIMQGLLYQGSTHFKRCACLIVEALARGGGLKTVDQEKVNNLFRELVRTLFLYDDETQLELKLAALRTLKSLNERVKPCSIDTTLLKEAVHKFQAFDDDRLQAEAFQVANVYGLRPMALLESH